MNTHYDEQTLSARLRRPLPQGQLSTLRWMVLVAIALMVAHDFDHLRVLLVRRYMLLPEQFVTVAVAYVPMIAALVLIMRRSALVAIGACLAGAVEFLGFVVLHLIGTEAICSAFDPFLGVWKVPFTHMHTDLLTWLVMAGNMAWCTLVVIYSLSILKSQLTDHLEGR